MAAQTCGCGVGADTVKCRWHAAQTVSTFSVTAVPTAGFGLIICNRCSSLIHNERAHADWHASITNVVDPPVPSPALQTPGAHHNTTGAP